MNLASRGLRDLDTGAERITDDLERRALAQQGRRVMIESLVWAVALTFATFAIPALPSS